MTSLVRTFTIYGFAALVLGLSVIGASAADKPKVGAQSVKVKTARFIYKAKPRRTLTVFYPDNWKSTDKRSALVIFRCNIPIQREHFRKLGMVIIKPLLAPVNSGQLPGLSLAEIAKLPRPRNQVEDAKSAIRYIRGNAAKLGVDPQQIVATGTSGGGDLALQSCINKAFEGPTDDSTISHRPDALVLYCPAFDGVDIWFVKMRGFLEQTIADAPAFEPYLNRFISNTTDQYATPVDHRAVLIKRAAALGKELGIQKNQIEKFQQILGTFNKRDWQLLHPFKDALKMSASRILSKEPLPPTLILFGDRDHLYTHQKAFVDKAKAMGKKFELKIYKNAGHSFMMQPVFEKPSTLDAETFLRKHGFLR